MQIVIDIDDETYRCICGRLQACLFIGDPVNNRVLRSIANGTPLPKGHGRILNEKDILDTENNNGGWYDLVDMPEYIAGVKAIIEADNAESEEV